MPRRAASPAKSPAKKSPAKSPARSKSPAQSKSKTQSLSVIVPAYNETPNIRPLTERLFAATRAAKLDVELLIADDESSGSAATAKEVKALAAEGYPVRLHARKRSEGRGLSSAVLLGFHLARHPVVLTGSPGVIRMASSSASSARLSGGIGIGLCTAAAGMSP